MYSRINLLLVLIILFTVIINANSLANTQRTIQIKDIIVKNNQRLDTETILSYLNIDSGDKINYEILNKKLKEMYKLGLFADIKLRVVNNDLIILVKENPMITHCNKKCQYCDDAIAGGPILIGETQTGQHKA